MISTVWGQRRQDCDVVQEGAGYESGWPGYADVRIWGKHLEITIDTTDDITALYINNTVYKY